MAGNAGTLKIKKTADTGLHTRVTHPLRQALFLGGTFKNKTYAVRDGYLTFISNQYYAFNPFADDSSITIDS